MKLEDKRKDFQLTPAQKMDAREALIILGDSGFTLADAALEKMKQKRAPNQITVGKAVRLFLKSRIDEDCRQATLEFYDGFLKPVVSAFDERILDTVTAAQLADCIDAATKGKTARTSIARASRALWRWAMKQREPMASTDATIGLRFVPAKKEGREPFVLSVPQCEAILRGSGRFRSALALMLFAGVRPEEIHGKAKDPLLWSAVDMEHKTIEIKAEFSKTRKRRVIEGLPAVIWEWLEPGKGEEAIAGKAKTRAIIECAKGLSGIKGEWPQDATRHTFASYMLAATANPGQVALWLGHEDSLTMLFNHYNKPGLKPAALKFLALSP